MSAAELLRTTHTHFNIHINGSLEKKKASLYLQLSFLITKAFFIYLPILHNFFLHFVLKNFS